MNRVKRAYIVEDFDSLAATYCRELEQLGVECAGRARTVAEALAGIAAERPELVILDLGLTGGSGMRILENYHQRSDAPSFVVVTNQTEPALLRQCEALGATRVFDKSHGFFDLLAYLALVAGRPVGSQTPDSQPPDSQPPDSQSP